MNDTRSPTREEDVEFDRILHSFDLILHRVNFEDS